MANNYYNHSGAPATRSSFSSATMRAEFAAIGQAADKLAPLTGNGDKVLVVNPGGTAQTSKTAATVVAEAGAGVASKATPVDADGFMVVDTEASNALKRLTWANLKTAVKGYYDSVVSTLTNKTINLASNTVTGTLAQFNTAVSDADLASLAGAETLTNKTLNLSSNTLSGTKAQFNTALSDADFLTTADLVTVPQGGTGVATITGLVKGNGAAAMSAAVAGTDYQSAQSVTGMVKSSGVTRSAAVAGTDYTSPTGAETLSSKTITGGSINNTPIGSTTPSTGAFTSVSATGAVTGATATFSTDGSDTIGAGAFLQLLNAAATRSWTTQLSASNNLDWWHLSGSWSKYMTLSPTGLSVTGAISATGKITSTYANGGGSDTPFSASHATGTGYGWSVTGQAVDGRNWDFVASGSTLALRTVNDANSVAANALRVTRSGNTVSTVETYAAGAVVSTASSTGVAVTGALSSTGRHAATSDQTTPTDGSAYFYKASAGATLSGYQVMLETGSAGSRSTKVTVDNSGEVGIGTTSPASSLDITRAPDATYNSHILLNSTTNAAKIAFNPSGVTSSGIGADATGLRFYGSDANTVRATLDYSGNLGLGVTPSAWSTYTAMQVGALGSISFDGGSSMEVACNSYYGSGAHRYISSSASAKPTRYAGANGSHYWYIAPSGTAGNAITFTQAMTLDANSNLAVTGSVTIGSFTTATRPAHAAGKMIYVSDASAGSKFQGSDGSSWVSLG